MSKETPEEMYERFGAYTDLELKASTTELCDLLNHYRNQVQVLREVLQEAHLICHDPNIDSADLAVRFGKALATTEDKWGE